MTYYCYLHLRDQILFHYETGAISEEEFLQQTKQLDMGYDGK